MHDRMCGVDSLRRIVRADQNAQIRGLDIRNGSKYSAINADDAVSVRCIHAARFNLLCAAKKTDGSKAADLVCARRVWWNIWFEAGTPHHVASHWRGDIVMAGRRVAGFDGDRCDQRSSNDFMLLLAPHGQCRLRSLAARRVAAADIPSRRHI
ncbi:hypothetical protein [Bradyrhizobium erythrophlei]|uniref:hypothetical protein n=1 Tax=Bradyrhizobium erythrophlei TaxID=1437360 RepID=UPI00115FEC9F|nr:hypothetical protein [Bradyrhizobium erythrophlei]